MVSFNCESCNDVIKKPKLDAHRGRCHNAVFSCIDCSTTFQGTDYRNHTSCISEEQKYQGALYRPDKGKGKKVSNSKEEPVPITAPAVVAEVVDVEMEDVKENSKTDKGKKKKAKKGEQAASITEAGNAAPGKAKAEKKAIPAVENEKVEQAHATSVAESGNALPEETKAEKKAKKEKKGKKIMEAVPAVEKEQVEQPPAASVAEAGDAAPEETKAEKKAKKEKSTEEAVPAVEKEQVEQAPAISVAEAGNALPEETKPEKKAKKEKKGKKIMEAAVEEVKIEKASGAPVAERKGKKDKKRKLDADAETVSTPAASEIPPKKLKQEDDAGKTDTNGVTKKNAPSPATAQAFLEHIKTGRPLTFQKALARLQTELGEEFNTEDLFSMLRLKREKDGNIVIAASTAKEGKK